MRLFLLVLVKPVGWAGWLFLTAKGARLVPKKLSDRISRYVVASSGDKPGACHLIRHTATTLMLEGGADSRFIQALLGHESLETTQIYAKVSIGKLAEIHAATRPAAKLASVSAVADAVSAAEDHAGT